jgi:hypothetical protein
MLESDMHRLKRTEQTPTRSIILFPCLAPSSIFSRRSSLQVISQRPSPS